MSKVEPESIFPPPAACKYDDALAKSRKESWDAIVRPNLAADGKGDAKLDWKFHSKEKDVDIFVRPDPNSPIQQTKGIGIINAPVGVAAFLSALDWDVRKKWDTQAEHNKVLEIIDPFTDICMSSFTAPWPVSSRDFVAVSRVEYLTGGGMWTWCTSVAHKDGAERSGYVRGTFYFSAMYFEPVDNNKKSKCTYILASNPGGSLPTFLVNSSTTSNPLAIDTCRKMLSPAFTTATQAQIKKDAETRVKQSVSDAKQAEAIVAQIHAYAIQGSNAGGSAGGAAAGGGGGAAAAGAGGR